VLAPELSRADALQCAAILDKGAPVKFSKEERDQQKKDKETAEKRAKYMNEIARLDRVEKTLLKEFVGWDDQIRQIMSATRAIVLSPELVTKPFVIPIMSFPGYGKTTLVQRFLTLMEWNRIERQIDVAPNEPFLSTAEIRQMGVHPGSKKEIQGVLTIDEVQNLMSEKQIAELEMSAKAIADKREYDYTKPDVVTQREQSYQFWWQVLGNGTVQIKPQRTPLQYIQTFNQYRSHIKSYEDSIDSSQKRIDSLVRSANEAHRDPELPAHIPTPDAPEKWTPNEKASIESWREDLKNTKANYTNFLSGSIEPLIKQMKNDQPELLGEWSALRADKIAEVWAKDPVAFVENIEKTSTTIRAVPVMDFRRIIIFVTGNPNGIIDGIHSQLNGAKIEPDTLRGLAMQIQPRDMQRWFHTIFGKKDGWDSRWNLDAWKMVLPFSNEQWRTMIDRRLDQFSETFAENLQEIGSEPIKLEFDNSVRELLYKVSVSPLNGPRSFYSRSTEVLASVLTNLRAEMIMIEPENRPKALTVSFDPARSEAVATEVMDVEWRWFNKSKTWLKMGYVNKGDREGYTSRMKIGVNENAKTVAPRTNESLSRASQALHQAGHAVVGMAIYKSLPMSVNRAASTTDNGIVEMWKAPDVNHHQYKRNQLMTMMGGYIAEKILMPEKFISDYGKTDLLFAQGILREIKGDVEDRRAAEQFRDVDGQKADLKEILPEDLYGDAVMKQLERDGTQAVFREVFDQVVGILRKHERLTAAIAKRLTEKPEIDAEEMKVIVNKYWHDRGIRNLLNPEHKTRKAILDSEPGNPNLKKNKLLERDYDYEDKKSIWQKLMGQ
jgi:hypothetical protein